jgi:hypothetical protein
MRSAFAILFSFLLIATQTAFMPRSVDTVSSKAGVKDCDCSHCNKPCCFSNGSPESRPLPATPTRTASQIDWQILAVIGQQLLGQPATASVADIPSSHPVYSLTAVPLYERNCSYLI